MNIITVILISVLTLFILYVIFMTTLIDRIIGKLTNRKAKEINNQLQGIKTSAKLSQEEIQRNIKFLEHELEIIKTVNDNIDKQTKQIKQNKTNNEN